MRVGLYARVSSEAQEDRSPIGSQVEALRQRMATLDHEVVAEFLDDGHSGARLDRPGLDALRDAAEAGQLEAVWCLTPDRLARSYAYQVLILDELARHGVQVHFLDAPQIADDPQARLLVQVQGVIAEYERAKITERNRRGRLFRARAGEIVFWRVPYGYRRLPRDGQGPSRLAVYPPEADVVRRIFREYVDGGHSLREIARRLYEDGIPTGSGRPVWSISRLSELLRHTSYVGRAFYNRSESVPDLRPGRAPTRQRPRPREEWIELRVPAIVSEDVFEAAQQVSRGNLVFSSRRSAPGSWLLRGLVVCGGCGHKTYCQRSPTRTGGHNLYYRCQNHDPLLAGGPERRCTAGSVRANELDSFVFEQVREALLRPELLLAGERALVSRMPLPDDDLLQAQVDRLHRRLEQADAEHRRLVDLYQGGFIPLTEVQLRETELARRRRQLEQQRSALTAQRQELADNNRLRQRIAGFAEQVRRGIDELDFEGRQRLLRLLVEEIRVSGWQVEIRLRIPLDEPPPRDDRHRPSRPSARPPEPVSSEDRLRTPGSLQAHQFVQFSLYSLGLQG